MQRCKKCDHVSIAIVTGIVSCIFPSHSPHDLLMEFCTGSTKRIASLVSIFKKEMYILYQMPKK